MCFHTQKHQFLILFFLTGFLLSFGCKETELRRPSIIPQPVELSVGKGVFVLNDETTIYHSPSLKAKADQLAETLRPATGFDLELAIDQSRKNSIHLILDNELKRLGEEGYELEVGEGKISISASTEMGIFYGIQTLRQLLPAQVESDSKVAGSISWDVPCLKIQDQPRFSWRGLMIDCSRTFWSIDYLKKVIDRMALYKMNVLHLHLTDDQGWRLEIKKYPELTEIGARFPEKWNEPKEREGFYSQEEMRGLIEYAANRNITIVPEIEMPGHCLAVLATYPDLACIDGPFEIHPFFKGDGIHNEILCAGNDDVFVLMEDVLSEVAELFPSKYIHIGGDEAPKQNWEACKKCQARIREEGLQDEHELQSWFVRRIEKYLNEHGKQLIGWDEIIEGGLSESATVMYWRGWMEDVPGKVIAQKNKMVMSPTTHCYFDYDYQKISTQRAYAFEPIPDRFTSEQGQHVLGAQANFWSHIDRTEEGVNKQLFPRLLSIAEVTWSPKESKDFDGFTTRVNIHLERLDQLGINYYQDSTVVVAN